MSLVDKDFAGCVEHDFAVYVADGCREVSLVLRSFNAGRLGHAEKQILDRACDLIDRLADGVGCLNQDGDLTERGPRMIRLSIEIERAAALLPSSERRSPRIKGAANV